MSKLSFYHDYQVEYSYSRWKERLYSKANIAIVVFYYILPVKLYFVYDWPWPPNVLVHMSLDLSGLKELKSTPPDVFKGYGNFHISLYSVGAILEWGMILTCISTYSHIYHVIYAIEINSETIRDTEDMAPFVFDQIFDGHFSCIFVWIS